MPLVDFKWYALQVRSRLEERVSEMLTVKGYSVFLPTFAVRKRVGPKSEKKHVPMFPGYLFCQYSSSLTNKIVDTPGLMRIVGFENGPAPVEDSEIASLRRICDSGVCATMWQHTAVGRKVRITSGPLTDVEGSFVRERSSDRIVVSISLLGRAVSVEIDGNDVVAV